MELVGFRGRAASTGVRIQDTEPRGRKEDLQNLDNNRSTQVN